MSSQILKNNVILNDLGKDINSMNDNLSPVVSGTSIVIDLPKGETSKKERGKSMI